MLQLNLDVLERDGSIHCRGVFPGADLHVAEGGPRLEEPVSVVVEARATAAGQILVNGTLAAVLDTVCRRCLEPVEQRFSVPLRLLFLPSDQTTAEDDGEIRVFDPELLRLDLTAPLREEFILSMPAFSECSADCRGLCPQCGANRNQTDCHCASEHADPRWERLRELANSDSMNSDLTN